MNPHIVLHTDCTKKREGSPFLHSSPAFITYRHFDDGHSDCSEVISHCSFDVQFSDN